MQLLSPTKGGFRMDERATADDAARQGTDPQKRLHSLVYSVVYPAFLGTFLFGLLSASSDAKTPHWGLLLACYFTLQQIEGSSAGSRGYGFWRTLIDGIEIALMVAAFDALDLFPADEPLGVTARLGTGPATIIFAILILPALARIASDCLGGRKLHRNGRNAAFYWALTIMSVAAACFALGYPSDGSFWMIAAI